MRETLQTMCDLNVMDNKRSLIRAVGMLRGWYEIDIRPRRGTITQQQRAYYWAVVIQSLSDNRKENGEEPWTKEWCHGSLKQRFLLRESVNQKTGVVEAAVDSIMNLSVGEMADYIDTCIMVLADERGIICPEPDPAWREHKVKRVEREVVCQ